MIIRRRHTSNYSTLPNSVFNDQRLALDEKGALGWFLTRPHDWEVNKAGCMRIWGVGRDKVNRIFRALITSGWARREILRAEDGTILGVRFIICDEPGAAVGETEADCVLADDADTDDLPGEVTADTPLDPGDEIVVDAAGNELPVAAQQQTEKASEDAGYPSTEKASTVLSNERILNTPPLSPPAKPTALPRDGPRAVRREQADEPIPDLAVVRKDWPEPALSPLACERIWVRLSDKAKRAAANTVLRYVADARANGRKICDLSTYLREARWERFAARGARAAPVVIKPGSPQFWRWREYRMATIPPGTICDAKGRSFTVQQMDRDAAENRGVFVPSEWPPPLPKAADGGACAGAADAIGSAGAGVASGKAMATAPSVQAGKDAALQAQLEADADRAAEEFLAAERK